MTTTDTTQSRDSLTQRQTLARVTGTAGLITLVVVLGASLINDYQSASFTSDADEAVSFFRSIDDSLGAFSSFATAVGLIAMLWFSIGLALLLRRYEGELPWRSAFLAGAGVISVVSGQIASWDAAAYRSADIDPQVARYAFDLGNLSFANGWVATGAVALCAGLIMVSARDLPSWLGWWAVVAGVGQVLGRAVWTHDIAMVPFAAFWIWVLVVSVLLLRGRFAVRRCDVTTTANAVQVGVGSEQLPWSGRDWRMPVWLWVGLATMFVSVLHIILDFGVGLFDLRGTLSLTEGATLVGVALIQLWWAISFMAGARGNGSGVASAGILGAGWSALTNGFPIVYCPPVCEEARPLTDLAHVGSIVFGILLALVAIWSLWRARVRPGWFMPAVAAALVVGTLVALANTPIT